MPTEQLGAIQKTCLQNIQRFHAVLHHEDVLAGLRAVRKWTDIGADSHGNAGRKLLAELLGVEIKHLVFAPGSRGSSGVIGEVFADGEGGHGEDPFLFHEAHGFIAELIGVINGEDTRLGGVESTGFSGGVDGDVFPSAGGFLDGRGKFGLGVLVGGGETALADGVGAGLIDFDEVRAFLELLANDGDELPGRIGIGGVGEDVLLGIIVNRIFVSAKDIDGVAADAESRAGDKAGVDCVADGGVGRTSAFGAHIAFGGETGEEIFASSESGDDRAFGNGFLNGLQVFRTRMKEKMDVGIDETGEERDVTEIENLRGRRVLDAGADFDDTAGLDKDFGGSNNLS